MRISFDLDDTLICHGGETPCEPRLAWLLRLVTMDEPLRSGTRRLANELSNRGHELWIYTTSHRSPRSVRWWLRCYGIKIRRVVNGAEHARCFGTGSSPTKRPHAFKIDLHVDDSPGVAMEGEKFGFRVCVVEPTAANWVERVLAAVKAVAKEALDEMDLSRETTMTTPRLLACDVMIAANRLFFGDAWLPPRGTKVQGVPNGKWPVRGVIRYVAGLHRLAEFAIDFGGEASTTETLSFSIDGGILGIETPRPDLTGAGFFGRRRMRREFNKQLHSLFQIESPMMSMTDSDGNPWAVVSQTGDGIFKLKIGRETAAR